MSAHDGESGDPIALLVLSEREGNDDLWRSLAEELPRLTISIAREIPDYRALLDAHCFDVVLFHREPQALIQSLLIHELKLMDHNPGMLVMWDATSPALVAALYDVGCSRFIFERPQCLPELAQALREIVRKRKADEAYHRTRARLTEINSMLEEKNRRLDEFSMTIAHDIRGPLGAITMKLEYVLDHFGANLQGRPFTLLQRALDSSRRLTDIVQAMYEYARLGSKAAKMQAVSLSALVQDAVSDLSFDEALDINIGIAQLPAVWGNAELLRRVFSNLISNAVKYNDKPNVIVNIGLAGEHERTLAKYCDIFVEDNGPGIPQCDLDGLFAMFSRGGRDEHRKDGLGVGLAVVQRIVELHFGQISVSSKLGQGTRFTLSLPMEQVNVLG